MQMRKVPYYAISRDEEALKLAIPMLKRRVISEGQHAAVIEYLIAMNRDWMLSRLGAIATPGLRIEFGLPSSIDILRSSRLSIYATLIADKIKEISGIQLSSIKLSKRNTSKTTLSIAKAIPTPPPSTAVETATLTTRRSYATPRFTSEVHDATVMVRTAVSSHKPVRLDLGFTTGLPRTWSRLWLPTISGIFPTGSPEDRFRDAQIVELELDHQSIGESLGHSVDISAALYVPHPTIEP
ncbi:hypothetical protein SBE55_14170 [Mycolicibacterium sp. 141076]|uniref:hypothetical protein n=1 Tax=Mycolicibacterium sp. 141076 TaxID=3090599 RepID=UPI00299CDA85|nr:hypothetical protein [Mycolicibacterium sp. 141076]MDX1878961.1 hypothetical protein [Mycolicibacterium sp. 141076]